ncbi:MAG: dephospho-CoA kinase [Aquificae bacterium]|nr:dephospho-CoA kinase [Aquificota bacterium]
MVKVGLTGSIATGKSTVAELFRQLGAYVIDADKIVHSLLEQEEIKNRIKEEFGDVFTTDGKVDRKKLANIVFRDKGKKKTLENILHPEVFKKIQQFFKDVEKKDPKGVAIAEVPLMIETGSYKHYDQIIVVYAPLETQIERLIKKGMSKEEALSRIKAQMPIEEKVKYGDFVINNTSTLQELKKQVEDIYQKLKEMV